MSSPATTQSDLIHDTLSTFYKDLSTAVSTGSAPPTVGDISTSLNYTDLETAAVLNKNASANLAVGSVVETVHLAAATLREYGMRVKSKSEYYLAGVADHSNEAAYFDKLKYARRAALTGTSLNGNLTQ